MHKQRKGNFYQGSFRVGLHYEGNLPRGFDRVADSATACGAMGVDTLLLPKIRDIAGAPLLVRSKRCRLSDNYVVRAPGIFARLEFDVDCTVDSIHEPELVDLLKAITLRSGAALAELLGDTAMDELAHSKSESLMAKLILGSLPNGNGHERVPAFH
ncbi:MAG TPA: hypothetical protein VFP35_01690 [Candidatus Saccharimonadales bacterium]|nr:hypothetical protein [Candidatus Saccharimonadales bacterium]